VGFFKGLDARHRAGRQHVLPGLQRRLGCRERQMPAIPVT